jgi:glutathione S-transferase
MLKLYGFPVSDYYNMVKAALLEKGFQFEEVMVRPGADPNFLAKSPMGKIPCLEVAEGCITETNVILEFIEDISSDLPLLPADSFRRAKVRELMKSTELYLELVARQLFGAVFFGAPLDDQTRQAVATQLDKGVAALNQLLQFKPYAAGAELTYADLMLYYTVTLGGMAVEKALGRKLADEIPGLGGWLALMDQNPSIQAVNRDRDQALKAMMGG